MYTQKLVIIFGHIMALDHRRLISGKKIRPTFLRSTSLLCKILSTNLGACKPTFIPFIHHIWGETVVRGTVFIIPADLGQKAVFHNTNCTHSKFPKHLYGHPVLTFAVRAVASVWMNINRVTLQHYKEFILFICNGNRTEWSPIRSVIIRVINKIGRPRSGSPICLITSTTTDWIGRHEVQLPINHNFNKIFDTIGYFLNQNTRNSKFCFANSEKKSHLSARVMARTVIS